MTLRYGTRAEQKVIFRQWSKKIDLDKQPFFAHEFTDTLAISYAKFVLNLRKKGWIEGKEFSAKNKTHPLVRNESWTDEGAVVKNDKKNNGLVKLQWTKQQNTPDGGILASDLSFLICQYMNKYYVEKQTKETKKTKEENAKSTKKRKLVKKKKQTKKTSVEKKKKKKKKK